LNRQEEISGLKKSLKQQQDETLKRGKQMKSIKDEKSVDIDRINLLEAAMKDAEDRYHKTLSNSSRKDMLLKEYKQKIEFLENCTNNMQAELASLKSKLRDARYVDV